MKRYRVKLSEERCQQLERGGEDRKGTSAPTDTLAYPAEIEEVNRAEVLTTADADRSKFVALVRGILGGMVGWLTSLC